MTSCSMKRKRSCAARCSILARVPVCRLSMQITALPRPSKCSHKCDPKKPAPPATRIVFICNTPRLSSYGTLFSPAEAYLQQFLKFGRTVGCSVMGQNAGAGGGGNGVAALHCGLVQNVQYFAASSGDENFDARLEEFLQSRPRIADHRHTASRRLEQANAGRMAERAHVRPRQVQGEALGAIEPGVIARRQMRDVSDVIRPLEHV